MGFHCSCGPAARWLPAGIVAAALAGLAWLPAGAREPVATPGASPAARGAACHDETAGPAPYRRQTASRDGIGKVYMGREIARVMGHAGADWLDRPEREAEERPALLIAALDLRPGMTVADIGAGTGYHTARLARAVGPDGIVYAVDVQPEMLALLERNLTRQGLSNWRPVLGAPDDPKLAPGSIDLALMVDVYHELEHPREALCALAASLAPGGRIAFVEYRIEDPRVPIKSLHKMSEAQIRLEARAAGLRWLRTDRRLPLQHLVIFERDAGGGTGKP